MDKSVVIELLTEQCKPRVEGLTDVFIERKEQVEVCSVQVDEKFLLFGCSDGKLGLLPLP